MTYIRVRWKHAFPTEPVWLYSELDDAMWEVRKVEVYADGHCGYASAIGSFGETQLGKTHIPSLSEIAADPEFDPVEIAKEEFDQIWTNRRLTTGGE